MGTLDLPFFMLMSPLRGPLVADGAEMTADPPKAEEAWGTYAWAVGTEAAAARTTAAMRRDGLLNMVGLCWFYEASCRLHLGLTDDDDACP